MLKLHRFESPTPLQARGRGSWCKQPLPKNFFGAQTLSDLPCRVTCADLADLSQSLNY
jgi:hypothetical protein